MIRNLQRGLLLLTCVCIASAVNSFIATFPNQLRPGMTVDVQVTLLQAHDYVEVTAKISRDEKSVVSNMASFEPDESEKIISLEVPFSAPPGSYEIDIRGKEGGKILFKNSTIIQYSSKSHSIFIQTDKAMYKQGQLVQFRVFAVNPELEVLNGKMDIGIFDPQGNKIAQWLDTPTDRGLFQDDFQLSDNPLLGDWKIEVDFKGQSNSKEFTVAEFVLPRFEVSLTVPPFGVTTDKFLAGTVAAQYTFGQGVVGEGKLTISALGKKEKHELTFDIDGEYKFKIALSTLEDLFGKPFLFNLEFFVEVEETLTTQTMNYTATMTYYKTRENLQFAPNSPDNFKPGLVFKSYLLLTDRAGRPISDADEKVMLNVTLYKYTKAVGSKVGEWIPSNPDPKDLSKKILPVLDLNVNKRGIAEFHLTIPFDVTKVDFQASYKTQSTQRTIRKFESTSGNYIQVDIQTPAPKAGKNATFIVRSTVRGISVSYLILSKGMVVESGQFKLKGKRIELDVLMTSAMAPTARCVVYGALKDSEILADSVQFNVEGIFKSELNLKFSAKKTQPGKKISLKAKADPGSRVSILTVDKSVLLLKTGNDITPTDVEDELRTYMSGVVVPFRGCGVFRCFFPIPIPGVDVSQIFSSSGLLVLTDAFLFKSKSFPDFPIALPMERQFDDMVMAEAPLGKTATGGQEDLQPGRVRTLFPETWIFDNIDAGTSLKTRVPDTITSWISTAFSLSNTSGLTIMSEQKTVLVFQNFFIDLRLPFSVIRDEQVILQANVFNFFSQDLEVKVTLKKSSGFDNIVVKPDKPNKGKLLFVQGDVTRNIMVKADSAVAVYFPIVAKQLGLVDIKISATSSKASDAVLKQLLVEPEGVPDGYNLAFLIDLREYDSFSETVKLSFPKKSIIVPGSKRVRISMIGDLMGSSIAGLDKLLTIPTGCGEQNMITMVPNIFVLNYLTAVNTITKATENKAKLNMQQGYQRELTYRHFDGSYSAFGNNDPSGSTWLTAFVVKSFSQASEYIYIDPKVVKVSLDWLLKQFDEKSGLFKEPGKVIHKSMQGGSATGERNLASYTLISLIEARQKKFKASSASDFSDVIIGAESSLEEAVSTMTDTFQMAIASYALALTESQKINKLLSKLDGEAIDKDGLRYWKQDTDQPADELGFKRPIPRPSSNSIELTSYVLLTYAKVEDINNGIKVIRWLIKQRNSNGGFGSTQDTVIALQALSEFAKMIFTKNFNMEIKVDVKPSRRSFPKTFNIDNDNALVLQSTDAPAKSKSIRINATGNGLALLEVAVFFHVKEDLLEPFFDLKVTFSDETLNGFKLKICFSWLGNGTSGMAVMEVGLLSGFGASKLTISDVSNLKRSEDGDKSIDLYFEDVDDEKICVSMRMEREGLVSGSQPARINLYSYYDRDKQVTTFYQPKLLKDSDVCDVGSKQLEDCW